MARKVTALLPLFFVFPLNATAAPLLSAQREIEHLLEYVESSRCEFQRNGSWYDAQKAWEHLRNKYTFVKTSISTTEDFIERAASRSSLTGQSYQVKCNSDAPVLSAQWLQEELLRFRSTLSQSSR